MRIGPQNCLSAVWEAIRSSNVSGTRRRGEDRGRLRCSLRARFPPLAMRSFLIAGALIALGLVISTGDALAVLIG